MKLSVRALMFTGALLWAGAVLLCGILNLIWPTYGVAFLQVVSSVYPGFRVTRTLGSVVIGTLYALLDGAVCGLLVGWLYNRLARA